MDIDLNKAVSLQQKFKADYYTDDPMKVINDPRIDVIYIASNHATHAEYAIEALKLGKCVHIEKPHAVSIEQLIRLCDAMKQYNGKVRLGFNRPNSELGQLVMQYLAKETGPLMLNWFVAGHEIDANHWYFSEKEGGRVLGNLCHWTDLILQMIPKENRFPVTIVPTRSERSDCDISVSYIFADGSIGTITFSAKGHTFEGVRETLNGHRGDTLVYLKDFKEVRIDIVEKVVTKTSWTRDHGHQNSITNTYAMRNDASLSEPIDYVWDTGYLVLKTKEALEKFEKITIQGYDISYHAEKNNL
jgi:predicted dehydrogenase